MPFEQTVQSTDQVSQLMTELLRDGLGRFHHHVNNMTNREIAGWLLELNIRMRISSSSSSDDYYRRINDILLSEQETRRRLNHSVRAADHEHYESSIHAVFNGQKVVLNLNVAHDIINVTCQTERGSHHKTLFSIIKNIRYENNLSFYRARANFSESPFGLKLANDVERDTRDRQVIFERKE